MATIQAKFMKAVLKKYNVTYNGEIINSVKTPVNRKTGEYMPIKVYTDNLTQKQIDGIKSETEYIHFLDCTYIMNGKRRGFWVLEY